MGVTKSRQFPHGLVQTPPLCPLALLLADHLHPPGTGLGYCESMYNDQSELFFVLNSPSRGKTFTEGQKVKVKKAQLFHFLLCTFTTLSLCVFNYANIHR